MHAVRTPLAGIGFAFALLLLETLAGRELVTDARALSAMHEQHEEDALIAAIKSGRVEIISCPAFRGIAIRYRVIEAMSVCKSLDCL